MQGGLKPYSLTNVFLDQAPAYHAGTTRGPDNIYHDTPQHLFDYIDEEMPHNEVSDH